MHISPIRQLCFGRAKAALQLAGGRNTQAEQVPICHIPIHGMTPRCMIWLLLNPLQLHPMQHPCCFRCTPETTVSGLFICGCFCCARLKAVVVRWVPGQARTSAALAARSRLSASICMTSEHTFQ